MVSSVSPSHLSTASNALDQSLNRISSGKRINSAADDSAGSAISEGFTSQNRGQHQAIRNAGDGISKAQTANGAIKSLIEGTQRIRELAVQSGNGTYTDEDRKLIDIEVNSIKEQMNSVLENSNFNGKPLFGNKESSIFQVGPNSGDIIEVEGDDLINQMNESGLQELSVASQSQAQTTLESADSLLKQLNHAAVENGALQNRFESRVSTLEQQSIDSAASRSRIADADFAKESSSKVQNELREKVGIAMQAQANQSQGNVLKLLG